MPCARCSVEKRREAVRDAVIKLFDTLIQPHVSLVLREHGKAMDVLFESMQRRFAFLRDRYRRRLSRRAQR